MPANIETRWLKWRHELEELANLKSPHCHKDKDLTDVHSVELHYFSDAILKGYGQCSYIRLADTNGKVSCSLVMSKARVTPIKVITISRLELETYSCNTFSKRPASSWNRSYDMTEYSTFTILTSVLF